MKTKTLALALAAALALPGLAGAAEPSPRIVVSGEGQAAMAPDTALLSFQVLRQADTAAAALAANSAAMAEVIAAMKAQGVAPRDLQTSTFSVNPRWVYPQNPDGSQSAEPPRIVGYDVVNGLTVRLRDLAKVGTVLDTAIGLGVNQGGQVTFVNDDPAAAFTEARKRAVADAVARARTLAEAAGVGVGRILEISEQNSAPQPIPLMEAKMMAADAGRPVPIEAGENAYRVQVTISFEIRQ